MCCGLRSSSATPPALDAATALAKLLAFRRDRYTVATAAAQAQASAKLAESAAGLAKAADAVTDLLDLARNAAASSRKGEPDLN